jgi:hypothetical protein
MPETEKLVGVAEGVPYVVSTAASVPESEIVGSAVTVRDAAT